MPQPASPAIRATRQGCPYLQSQEGARCWHPTRDSVCVAASARAHLRREKQSSLCLREAHESCETYLAAQGLDGRRAEWSSVRRRIASTQTVVIAGPSTAIADSAAQTLPAPIARVLRSQVVYQATVAVLMLVALTLLGIRVVSPWLAPGAAPSSSHAASTAAALPSASPGASGAAMVPSAPASLATSSGATTAPSGSGPVGSASASGLPSQRPSQSFETYVVRDGDSLWTIAEKYGTTVAALRAANGLTATAILHTGDIVYIPR